MSKSWTRRPHRRGAPHGRTRHLQFNQRACCPTHGREPHAADCRRDPRMCGVKAAFDTEREALSQIEVLRARASLAWRTYLCPWCELYHLTTKVEE